MSKTILVQSVKKYITVHNNNDKMAKNNNININRMKNISKSDDDSNHPDDHPSSLSSEEKRSCTQHLLQHSMCMQIQMKSLSKAIPLEYVTPLTQPSSNIDDRDCVSSCEGCTLLLSSHLLSSLTFSCVLISFIMAMTDSVPLWREEVWQLEKNYD